MLWLRTKSILIAMYLPNPSAKGRMRQGQFVSEVLLVLIQNFPFSWLVARLSTHIRVGEQD